METLGWVQQKLLTLNPARPVYFGKAPADVESPFIIVSLVSATDRYYIPLARSLTSERINVTVYGDGHSASTVAELGEAVYNKLVGAHDDVVGSVRVLACHRVLGTAGMDEDQNVLYTYYRQDFIIFLEDAT